MRHRTRPVLAALTTLLAAACATLPAQAAYNTLDGLAPLVIGHRGASGYLPEHTLESYAKAIALGANVIEPDLVMTKDGFFVARHEPMLDSTTDVASKFGAARMATKMLDGVSTTAYFTSDFTLAEIKTLRAIQPRANRPQEFNGLYGIPTLDEIVALAQSKGTAIYPEVKHSTFHANIFGAHVFEDKLVSTLHAAYGNSVNAPVFIQSFEISNLQYLNGQTNIRLVQLVDADDVNADGSVSLVDPYRQPYDVLLAGGTLTFAEMLLPGGLVNIKAYADGIGPWKPYLVKTVADGVDRTGDGIINLNDRRVDGSTGVIESAHSTGLFVHAYTFRNDASGYGFADPKAEMAYYMTLGVDGVFTDFADTGVAAVASIPEPATWALLLGGVAALAFRQRRTTRQTNRH